MEEFEQAREIALKFLDYGPRTVAEVRNRLTRAECPEPLIEEVLESLTRAGLLDDERFSQDWVESRSRSRNVGRIRLAAELRRKGIDKELVEQTLDTVSREDEVAAALEAARRKASPDDLADPAARRRLAAFLQRRGYNWEIIEQVFTKLVANNE